MNNDFLNSTCLKSRLATVCALRIHAASTLRALKRYVRAADLTPQRPVMPTKYLTNSSTPTWSRLESCYFVFGNYIYNIYYIYHIYIES